MMNDTVIGLLRNISELIVATLVEETPTSLIVKNPAFLGISGENNKINVNFIPVEMLSLAPAVNIRNLLADPTQDLLYEFRKDTLFQYNLVLAKNVVENYSALTRKPEPSDQHPTTSVPLSAPGADNIVKLF